MLYYLISIKWTYRNNFVFELWNPASNGYTYFKHKSGLYNKESAFKIAHGNHFEGAFPVPQNVVDQLWTQVMYEPTTHPQKSEIIINNSYTRNAMRIDPFWMHSGDRGVDRHSFELLEDCPWIKDNPEPTKRVKTNRWDITIREPEEPYEFGSQGTAIGKTYREARKDAFRIINDQYMNNDYLLTMSRFKIKRISEDILVNPIPEHPWGE